MKFIVALWRFFLYAMDLLLLLRPPKKIGSSEKKRVLILRTDVIGDFIVWLDAAKAYRTLYPKTSHRLTLLGNRIWKELADELDYFDDYIYFERKKFLRNPVYRFRFLKMVRGRGFDSVIQSRYSKEFIIDDAIVRTCGAREKTGLAGDTANISPKLKKISSRWYTNEICTPKKDQSEILRNQAFMKGLGAEDFTAGTPVLSVNSSLLKNFPDLPKIYYVLAPGAGAEYRKWPSHKFSRLADRISKSFGLTGIICGSLSDRTVSQKIIARASADLIDFTGRTCLTELVAIIHYAEFIISNESAAIHVAAAVDTPSVCILGGGHFGRFLPYPDCCSPKAHLPVSVFYRMDCFLCNWQNMSCSLNNQVAPCVENISVDAVWTKTKEIMDLKA